MPGWWRGEREWAAGGAGAGEGGFGSVVVVVVVSDLVDVEGWLGEAVGGGEA